MRPWTLPSLLLAIGCATSETPNDAVEPPPQVESGDDAAFGGVVGAGETPPGDNGISAAASDADSTALPGTDPNPADSNSGDPGDLISVASSDATAAQDDAEPDPDPLSVAAPPFDAGEGGICQGTLAPGDLIIDELMIESIAGAGDHGEWLEVESTLDCALDLRGLHGDAPSGNKVRTFDVGTDVWIPAFGSFVVADSDNAAIDHDLPGTVIAWSGQPGDVLGNKGGTVTLEYDEGIIDSVTYPSMALTVGASLAFPSDCMPSQRSDWSTWQTSTFDWFPGFFGTPNAPNDDVQCP